MEEKHDSEKIDEVILPGFRFHPTDEELVGFYLKRKIQQRPLSIELIKQLDIYKFDPWDLPSMYQATLSLQSIFIPSTLHIFTAYLTIYICHLLMSRVGKYRRERMVFLLP